MNREIFKRLTHLKGLADSAHAEVMQVSTQLRESRRELVRLQRHKQDMVDKGFDLAAPDAAKLEELEQSIDILDERNAKARADHQAKRQLADRCEQEAQHAT